MRIHTSLTRADLRSALPQGVYLDVTDHGSRKRERAFDVALSTSHGTRRRNPGSSYGGKETIGEYAATWDEWGLFLASLFAADPTTIAGDYDSAEDFAWKTGGHYGDGAAMISHCPNHKWQYDAGAGGQYCKKGCGAVRRWQHHLYGSATGGAA